ncbi:sigma-70 family RNA polymerase sigma factor [Acinetobacter larvae]|uniref:RNA polymerase subunit sigma n=1 Tax=Acinetobacter larvae TaxID=1789224 RepID=A0A1B2LZQ1_9GAMM|nr:sigma-70 family RNA polymerase sigma factor [Acinetobacter larvae]AOA58415.1 RNA polymerase subunit sigma [Acinetobacter larvae]
MVSLSQHGVAHLYREHHSWIYQWLYHRLGNSADAADLAHDTFLRVMVREHQYHIEQPRAYLTVVAKGLMVSWFRRKHIERNYLVLLAERSEQTHPSTEQHYLIIETLVEISLLLEDLPHEVRLSFLYAQLEGLKYQDIADKLNLSLSTVKRHVKKAYLHCLTAMMDHDC